MVADSDYDMTVTAVMMMIYGYIYLILAIYTHAYTLISLLTVGGFGVFYLLYICIYTYAGAG